MIEWLSVTIIALALIQTLVSVGFALKGSAPNDYTLGFTALLAVAMVAQVVVTIVMQAGGQAPRGDGVELWAYLVTAVLLAPAGIVWGLVERTKWATWALSVVGFSLAVMAYRMYAIWFLQVA
jgi:hypothetical protein